MITGDAPIVAGTCRFCGCTEAAACVGGCSWTDESQTFCSRCLGVVTVAMALVAAVGVVASGPRPLIRSREDAWSALPIAAQRALVAAVSTHIDEAYDDLAQEIMDEAFLDVRAIATFLEAKCPDELEKSDESISECVIRLLEPHVGSRIVIPGAL